METLAVLPNDTPAAEETLPLHLQVRGKVARFKPQARRQRLSSCNFKGKQPLTVAMRNLGLGGAI